MKAEVSQIGLICAREASSAGSLCHIERCTATRHWQLTQEQKSPIQTQGFCAIRAPLKSFAPLAFRWILIGRVKSWRKQKQQYKYTSFYSFPLKAKCINIQLAALKKSSFWTFLIACRCLGEDCCKSVSWGGVLLYSASQSELQSSEK